MAARAEIMARMGLDRSGFSRGIDGAKQEAAGFQVSLTSIRSAVSAAFAVAAIREFADTARELRQYQDDKGIVLVSPEQLDLLERTGDMVDKVTLKLKGWAVTVAAVGLKAGEYLWARAGALSGGASWSESGDIAANQVMQGKSAEAARREADAMEKKRNENAAAARELERMRYAALDTEDKLREKKEQQARLSGEVVGLLKIIDKDETTLLQIEGKKLEARKAMLEVIQLEKQLEKELQAYREKSARDMDRAAEERRQREQQLADMNIVLRSSSIEEYESMMKRDREVADIMTGRGMRRLPSVDADSYARMGGAIGRQMGAADRAEQRRMQILENLNAWLTRNNEGGGLGD